MKHFGFNTLPYQSSSSKTGSSGGSTTIVNNITNVTNVTDANGDANYQGKITITNLLALDKDTVSDDYLYLVYSSYSSDTGWSAGTTFYAGALASYWLHTGALTKTVRLFLQSGAYKFTISGLGAGNSTNFRLYESDESGTLIGDPYWSAYVDDGDYTINVPTDAEYVTFYSEAPLCCTLYQSVPDGSFLQLMTRAQEQADGSVKVVRDWSVVSGKTYYNKALFEPLPNSITLLTQAGSNFFPELHGAATPGMTIGHYQTYNLDTNNVYKLQQYSQSGTYAGTTDTRALVVPYARHYTEGSTEVYTDGLLMNSDYQRFIERTNALTVSNIYLEQSPIRCVTGALLKSAFANPITYILDKAFAVITLSASAQYINTGKTIGATISLTPKTSTGGNHYAIVDCVPGQTFLISARGGAAPRAWAYVDADNKLLSVAASGSVAYRLRSTAPANAAKLIINSTFTNLHSYAEHNQSQGGTGVQDVQVNGSSVVLNNIAYVSVPTKTSDITNDSGFIDASGLSNYLPISGGTLTNQSTLPLTINSTESSSSYVGLSFQRSGNAVGDIVVKDTDNRLYFIDQNMNDKKVAYTSDIPTPVTESTVTGWGFTKNAGTITQIKRNGVNVSTAGIADISVPTKTSDITNDSDFITSSSLDDYLPLSGGTISSNNVVPLYVDCSYSGTASVGIGFKRAGVSVGELKYSDQSQRLTFIGGSTNNTLAYTSEIPTKTSDLTNDSGYTTNIGTITQIKRNGTSVATSGVADISVPVNISDLTDDRVWTCLKNGTGSNAYAIIGKISHTPKAYKEWSVTIDFEGTHSGQHSNATIHICGSDTNTTTVATPTAYFTARRLDALDNASVPYVRFYRQSNTEILVGVYKSNLYADAKAKLVFSSGTTFTKMDGTTLKATTDSYIYEVSRPDFASKSWVTSQGYTTNTGTITGVSVDGTSVATSGVANIQTNSFLSGHSVNFKSSKFDSEITASDFTLPSGFSVSDVTWYSATSILRFKISKTSGSFGIISYPVLSACQGNASISSGGNMPSMYAFQTLACNRETNDSVWAIIRCINLNSSGAVSTMSGQVNYTFSW